MANWVKGEDPMQLTNKSTDRNAYNELQLRFVELVEEHKALKQKHEDLIDKTQSMGTSVSKLKRVLVVWDEVFINLSDAEQKDLKQDYHVLITDKSTAIQVY